MDAIPLFMTGAPEIRAKSYPIPALYAHSNTTEDHSAKKEIQKMGHKSNEISKELHPRLKKFRSINKKMRRKKGMYLI